MRHLMPAGKSHTVRLDAETEARVLRILDHMREADPYRDTNDADVLRVLIRRGATDYEREHGLPALAPAAPAAKKGAKRKARKP